MKMEFDFTKPAPHYDSLIEVNKYIDAVWLNARLLQKENEELQEKINLNSANSSLPSSSQPTYNRKKKFWRKLSFGTQSERDERNNRFIVKNDDCRSDLQTATTKCFRVYNRSD